MISAGESTTTAFPRLRIAIAGNPNSGKTTVFNSLTGLRHQVGNYPGITVEKREGWLRHSDRPVLLLDLPGTYSLAARSPDEEVARETLLGGLDGGVPDGVLVVLDAANLERNLYLASQILDLGLPVVIACNMMDVAESRGLRVDCAALAETLGVPVCPVVASRRSGISELRRALQRIERFPSPPRPWCLAKPFEEAIERGQVALAADGVALASGAALLWLCDYLSGEGLAHEAARRFLCRQQPSVANELRAAAADLAKWSDDPAAAAIETRYAWISQVSRRSITQTQVARGAGLRFGERLDHLLTHRVWGLLIFALLLLGMFFAIFWLAEPAMGWIESGQHQLINALGEWLPAGSLRSLLTDGIITGVGAVLTFFPQIAILFFCLALLEDSGYMARATFLVDRLMSRVGLHGRSFVPLLCGFACAVPGIMATRTISHRRVRLATILVIPLMTCSARLPVYLTILGAVFPGRPFFKAGCLLGLYLAGAGTALLMAFLFKRTLLAGGQTAFIMELPAYHIPRWTFALRTAWDRARDFLVQAGTIIFAASIVIWALSYFPRPMTAEQEIATGSPDRGSFPLARLHNSYLGRLGRTIEPVLAPLGFDWRISTGLFSSVLAREAFVSTLGITLAVEDVDVGGQIMRERLAAATWPDGRKLMTPLVGVSLMVFYVLACQCISTLAVVGRETRSWKWPVFMFGYMTTLAYAATWAVFQIGQRLGY